jgi:excisionase family DNA binding protein
MMARTPAKITALPPPASKGLLSVRQAAAYLNVAEGTLRNWMSEHRVAYVKIGSRSHFRLGDLDAFIEAHLVRAVAVK